MGAIVRSLLGDPAARRRRPEGKDGRVPRDHLARSTRRAAAGGYLSGWPPHRSARTRLPVCILARSHAQHHMAPMHGMARLARALTHPRWHICEGVWLLALRRRIVARAAATSALGLGSPLPHLRRDWAHPCHICAGTGPTPATSAPGLRAADVNEAAFDGHRRRHWATLRHRVAQPAGVCGAAGGGKAVEKEKPGLHMQVILLKRV